MPRLAPLLFLLAVAALPGRAAAGDGMTIGTIPLHHRTAAELVPQLKPFVAAGGAIGGVEEQILVRSTAENIFQLQRLAAELDTIPRQLVITVKQDVDARDADRGGTVYGTAPRAGGVVEETPGRLRLWTTRSRNDSADTQSVRVVDGAVATLHIGRSIPVVTQYQQQNGPQGRSSGAELEYKEATVGFTVRPRVSGSRVTLELNPQRDVPSRRGGGEIDTQRLATTVSGTLGEWLDVGGAVEVASSTESGIVYQTRNRNQQLRRVWVKVEEVDAGGK